MALRKLFKNYINIIIAQVFTSLVAVIIVKVSLKHVSIADYGNIILILTASNTIQIFLNWTCTALVRFGVEEFISDKSIMTTFWARTVIFLINLTVVIAFSPLWFKILGSFLDFHDFIKPLIITHIVVASCWMHGQQALQAARKPQMQSYLLLVERLFTLLIITIVVKAVGLKWESIFKILMLSSIIMLIISLIILKPFVAFTTSPKIRQASKNIFLFSLPLFPFAITSFFCTNYLNAYFINAYLSKADLTIFNTIFQITGLLTQLPILFNMLVMPQFISMRMDNRQEDIKRYIEEVLPLLTVFWGIAVGIAAICLVWFIPSFFGAGFYGISALIVLLSAAALFSFPSLVGHSPFILSLSDVKVSFPMALITALVNILAQFVLIKPFGLAGSAVATILSTLSGLIYLVLYVSKKYKFKSGLLFVSLTPTVISVVSYILIPNIIVFISTLLIFTLFFLYYVRQQIRPYINIALVMLKVKTNG